MIKFKKTALLNNSPNRNFFTEEDLVDTGNQSLFNISRQSSSYLSSSPDLARLRILLATEHTLYMSGINTFRINTWIKTQVEKLVYSGILW